MGLKQIKFIEWFQNKFPEAVRNVPNSEGSHFDSVFIDLNGILHPAIRNARDEAMFVKNLFAILDHLLVRFIPSRICYLSIDGPAPVAKILTQKARRATKSSKKNLKGMSSLHLTPGCPFMLRLEQYVSYYAVRYLQQRQSKGISPDLKFVIDHSNNPGEGESKIIENIKQQAQNIRERPCAILSMDSDAVLQAIALGLPNIYVVRQDAIFNPAIVVSIDKFMRILEEQFPGQSNRVRLDFCALCLFRGNDYLRGLAVRLEQLWKAYLFTKLIDPTIQGLRTGIEAETGEHQFLIDAKFKTFDLLFLKQLILNSYKDPKKLQLSPDPAQQDQTTLKSKRWPRKQKPRPDPESTQPNQPSIPIITKKNAGLTSNVHVDIVQDQVYGHDSDKESIDKSEGPENDVSDDDSGDIEALRATTNIDNYDAANEKEEEGVQEEEEEKDECEEEEEEEEDNGNSSKRFLSDDPIALKSPRSSVKKFLEGILWNLEMYCSGTCPDVSFRYEYHCAPPRRAVIAYIDSIMDPSKDTYKDLVPSTTVRLLNVTRTAKKYLHPLVCGLILLPVDGGAAYLPQSIAAVHTQIVSVQSPDVHLSQDEMEAIDAKVKHLIEILQSSDKNQDAAIAQELADLYDTRSPYIWTRVRRLLNQHAKPTAMPHSPSFIIQQLQDPSITFDQTQTLQFSHLEFQPDIIRSLVKVPPKTASYTATTTTTTMTASKTAAQDLSQDAPLQQNNIDTNISVSTTAATTVATGILLPSNQIRDPSAPWAVEARQDAITKSGKAPPIQWPFHYIHRNGNMRQRRLAGHGHIAHGHVHGPPSHHFHSHDKHQHGYHQAQQPQPFTLLSKAQQPNSMLEAQQPTSAPTSQQPTSQPKQHRRHLQRPPSRRVKNHSQSKILEPSL